MMVGDNGGTYLGCSLTLLAISFHPCLPQPQREHIVVTVIVFCPVLMFLMVRVMVMVFVADVVMVEDITLSHGLPGTLLGLPVDSQGSPC
jgi:hypothetical protein